MFTTGGDRKNPYSAERRTIRTGLFFIARHPVTCAEYLDFLNSDPDGLAARAPRSAPASGFYWPRDARGDFVLPTSERIKAGGLEGAAPERTLYEVGALMPMAGHKGYGPAMLVEILAGVLGEGPSGAIRNAGTSYGLTVRVPREIDLRVLNQPAPAG